MTDPRRMTELAMKFLGYPDGPEWRSRQMSKAAVDRSPEREREATRPGVECGR